MIVCGQDFNDDAVHWIAELITHEPDLSRRQLSRRVCMMLDWRRADGALKDMSCRKALAKLHKLGVIDLPPVDGHWAFQTPAAREAACPEHAAFTGMLAELGTVEVVPVGSRGSPAARAWNAVMRHYHPLGSGPLCGAQLRYLIRSERYGLLGGLSFSAAAWQLAARDRFIGWTPQARAANRQLVVCNSRFLIVPGVQVAHLASHVLGRCVRRLCADWQQRYAYRPALAETFVQSDRFAGTCYRAAGWIEVGRTAGRGRQDRDHAPAGPVKTVLVKPLADDWQQTLCRQPDGQVVLIVPARKTPHDWAEEEFADADLGDTRLDERLRQLARQFYGKPMSPITMACEGTAGVKAAYRFFDNEKTSMDKVLQPHIEATIRRMHGRKLVLVPQDTTSLNYTAHPATDGLGPIHNGATGAIGLELHSSLAFTPDGTPLGLLHAQCWARDAEPRDKAGIKTVPIEEKESFKWIEAYRELAAIQKRCRHTRLISITDREGDVYDLFAEARDTAGPGLLVRQERSRRRRVTSGDDQQELLWDAMRQLPVAAVVDLHLPRRDGRPARTARVDVRFGTVTLNPPAGKQHLGPVSVWAVYAREKEAPSERATSDAERPERAASDADPTAADPLEWMVTTTEPTDTPDAAVERLEQYGVRWGIEVFHRTLKSGCSMEDRQLHNAKRLTTCLAIDMVVAWRIFYLTKLGRETPDVPCTVFFQDDEWRALVCFSKRTPERATAPPTLAQATVMVAKLGGFLARKRDGDPGTETMWRGLQRLDDITATWQILSPDAAQKTPTVSEHDYG